MIDINKTTEILEKEYELYQQVNKLALKKQDIIIAGDLDNLEEIVKKEEKIIEEIKELEKYRLDINENADITELLKSADKDQREKLEDLRKKLLTLTVVLKEQNILNGKLIADSLKLNSIKLDLAKGGSSTNTYNKKGVIKQQTNTFVNKRA